MECCSALLVLDTCPAAQVFEVIRTLDEHPPDLADVMHFSSMTRQEVEALGRQLSALQQDEQEHSKQTLSFLFSLSSRVMEYFCHHAPPQKLKKSRGFWHVWELDASKMENVPAMQLAVTRSGPNVEISVMTAWWVRALRSIDVHGTPSLCATLVHLVPMLLRKGLSALACSLPDLQAFKAAVNYKGSKVTCCSADLVDLLCQPPRPVCPVKG